MTGLERRLYNQLVKVRRATVRQVRENRMAAKLERATRELQQAEGWGRAESVRMALESEPESGQALTQRGRAVAS